jgi:hypothetical protein
MPNWCDNSLTLTHDDPKMIHRAVKAFGQGKLLNEFIPVPDALMETMSGSYGDEVKQAELEAQQEHNRQTYGYSTWYDFCVNEWGTKWDVGSDDGSAHQLDKNNVKFYFQSAWSPPTDAYRKLEDLGFSINAFYYEPGAAFAGCYYDGEDDTYELNGLTSGEVEELIPAELNEEFGIVEQMAEWESEQEDE